MTVYKQLLPRFLQEDPLEPHYLLDAGAQINTRRFRLLCQRLSEMEVSSIRGSSSFCARTVTRRRSASADHRAEPMVQVQVDRGAGG